MMKGFLVRVGIDQAYGGWNAPYEPKTGHFAYVTIPEDGQVRPGLGRKYDEFIPGLKRFSVDLPPKHIGTFTHLDPDFDYLTYGDHKRRAKQLSVLERGDFIAFYSSMRSTDKKATQLVYALIGIYHIDKIEKALDIPENRWPENAHTRIIPGDSDIVIYADKSRSGRLRKALPIGEYRNRAYRVKINILVDWGGLKVKNGFIQLSGTLPMFLNPEKFILWWDEQNGELIQKNSE